MLRGGFWLGFGSSFEYGLRFLRNIILVRILAPEAFGLMAIVIAVNSALESFTQIGVREAVIQSPAGEEETYLNGAWWLSFVRAVGLCTIAMISTPWITSFYNISQYSALIRVSFLTIPFNGSMSANSHIVLKKMDYKKWILISTGGGTLGILTAIGLSLWFHNVWALVIGYVTEAAARCLLSFIICPFLPRMHFMKEHVQALFKFSQGMFGLPILYLLFRQTDIFVVGKLLSKNELGLYSMAVSLAQIPMLFVATVMNPILMPLFSEKQNDKAWINRTMIRSTQFIALAGMPIGVFAALYGKDLLAIIYKPEYSIVALPFALILGSTLLRATGTPIMNVYLSMGKPQLNRYFSAVRAAAMLLLIYPSVKYFGLIGAASVGLFAMLIGYILQIVRLRDLTNLDPRQYSMIFLHAFMFSLPVIGVWFLTRYLVIEATYNILLGLSGSIVVYVLLGIIALRLKARIFDWLKKNTKRVSIESESAIAAKPPVRD